MILFEDESEPQCLHLRKPKMTPMIKIEKYIFESMHPISISHHLSLICNTHFLETIPGAFDLSHELSYYQQVDTGLWR